MLMLYDVNHVKLVGLTTCKEIKIDKEINLEDTLSFSFPMKDPKYLLLKEECYIRSEENEYVVKEISYSDATMAEYICKVNLEDLRGTIVPWFETVDAACLASVNMALVGTGWSVESCDVVKIRTIEKADSSVYVILQEIQSLYGCEMTFNAITKKISVYQAMGSDKGAYAAEQLNLVKVDVQSNSYDYITRLIPIGYDKLDITLVNGGLNYIENTQYSSKIITAIWEDNRYTVEQDLLDDAIDRLAYLSWPYRAYKADIIDLSKIKPQYSILDYSLGDMITLMANSQNIYEKQRIIKMTVYPEEPERNTCEVANKILSLEQLQVRFEETSTLVDTVTTPTGALDGTKVDGIDWTQLQNINILMADIQDLDVMIARIGSLEATSATITQLAASNAAIGNLEANSATIEQLNAVSAALDVLAAASINVQQLDAALARIGTLETTRATIAQLNAVNAAIETLTADKATVAELNAAKIRVGTLETGVATINNLLAGNITADNLAAGAIQAGDLAIANGAIASAQIANLDVGKLLAGEISTNKFDIQSDNGRLKMVGDTIKLIDLANKERVSLGLNGTDYNLLIRAADGTTVLFGIDGVTHAGITDGAVDDSKVAAGAAINGAKIEKESLVSQINGATTLLKSSHVKYDPTGQTFEVAFGALLVTVTAQGTTLSSQATSISTLQGEIVLKATKTELTATNAAVATAQSQADLGVTNAALAQAKANTAFADAATAHGLADTAQAKADTAFTNAGTANGLLADLASDSKLTAVEKQLIKKEWDGIMSEKTLNDTQADLFGITTEKTDYGTVYSTLSTYITALLSNLASTSDIVGADLRTNFKNYYDKQTILLNAIAAKTKLIADTSLSDATAAQALAGANATGLTSLTARVNTAETALTPTSIKNAVESITGALASKTLLEQTSDALTLSIATKLSGTYKGMIDSLTTFFSFQTEGMLIRMLDGNGVSRFATLYSADKIQFLQDGNVTQWLSGFKNYMTDLVVTGSFSIGQYMYAAGDYRPTHKFESLANKHVVVRYIGG